MSSRGHVGLRLERRRSRLLCRSRLVTTQRVAPALPAADISVEHPDCPRRALFAVGAVGRMFDDVRVRREAKPRIA